MTLGYHIYFVILAEMRRPTRTRDDEQKETVVLLSQGCVQLEEAVQLSYPVMQYSSRYSAFSVGLSSA